MRFTEKMHSVDLKNPDLYLDGVPYGLLAELRQAAPLHWNPETMARAFWSVLRYADIAAISKDPETFSSAHAHGGHRLFNENERGVGELGESAIGVSFISTDPPLHRWYRAAVLPGLKLSRVREMGDRQFAFVLGAGASATSGIPTGWELVMTWLRELQRQLDPHYERRAVEHWATAEALHIPGFEFARAAEFYPDIFEMRFRDG